MKGWIRGEEYVIASDVVVSTLGVPLAQQPMYPYTETPYLDDIMSLITGTSISWATDPRVTSHELTELNYLFFRISCHFIWPNLIFILSLLRDVHFCTLSSLMLLCVFSLFLFAHLLKFIGVVPNPMACSFLSLFIGFFWT